MNLEKFPKYPLLFEREEPTRETGTEGAPERAGARSVGSGDVSISRERERLAERVEVLRGSGIED